MLAGSPGLEVLDVEETGSTAIASIAQHEPDAVIVDTILEGMSGTALIRQIRRRFAGITIVAMSASLGRRGEAQLIEAGANAVLRKAEMNALRHQLAQVDSGSTAIQPSLST
jgi:two-component system secretion response regulator SsrB